MKQKNKLGVVVPYRNRESHLKRFIPYIKNYLIENGIDFEIIVVEQDDKKPFNRGKLLNIGFELLESDCNYFVFHDVDMLPVDADYSYVDKPIHMATQLSNENYELQFPSYFGGVTLFNRDDFKTINGYSNEYFGWGFEDDDLLYRCVKKELPIDTKIFGNNSRMNYSMKFNGDSDYIEIDSPHLFNFLKNDFTIYISGKPKNIILDKNNKNDYDEYFFISQPGYNSGLSFTSFNRYKSELWNKDKKSVSINSEITGEHWVQLCLTKKNNLLSFYIDGKLVDSKSIDSVYDYGNVPFYIGCANPKSMFFKGMISDVALWNKSLSETQIEEIVNESLPITKTTPEELLVYYDFKNIINDKVIDLSGKDIHGKLNGCQQIEYDSKQKSSIPIPYRREGRFQVLSHKRNSWNGMKWIDKLTRLNQLKFFNEVRTDLFDMNIEGLNTLRYKITNEETFENYRKVSVQ
tara:strand:- start:27463 stop:28851 length:1389 start_codon:yes stop_codon:yes gene_type:complete